MEKDFESFALEFLERKQRNLSYFKKFRPELYDYFHNLDVINHELVLTPEKDDVDLTYRGETVYRHIAKDYSTHEAQAFLERNSRGLPLKTYAPLMMKKLAGNRMASSYLRRILDASNLEKFEGYWRGDIFPSIIFLGCGLAYHIEYLADRAEIVDAVVFEPEKERFALTLFTVDWERICRIFRDKGHSISFCIAIKNTEENLRNVLFGKVQEMSPIYPNFCIYYNHLANVELFKVAKDVEADLPILNAHWGGYDFEARAFRNVIHNIHSGSNFLGNNSEFDTSQPVVIVGSGPSIDDRIEDIRSTRENIILVSAGTGLRGLLANGLRPDYHVEAEADAIINRVLGDLNEEYGLSGVTLLLSINGNPGAMEYFDETVFFLPALNYIPQFLGVNDHSIYHCSPTCTNSALAIFYAVGGRRFFLFGTDYGFYDKEKNHSKFSIYGESPSSIRAKSHYKKIAETEKSRETFSVKSVTGESILTRTDYFAAKRAVEEFVSEKERVNDGLAVHNCSDGAEIEGAEWLNRSQYLLAVQDEENETNPEYRAHLDVRALSVADFENSLTMLLHEFRKICHELQIVLDSNVVSSRDALIVIANQLRAHLNRMGPHSGRGSPLRIQGMTWQLLKGTVKRMLQAGLEHGLARQSDEELVKFGEEWRVTFSEFLTKLPEHFESVVKVPDQPISDPWVLARLVEAEPGFGSEAAR